MHYVFSPSSSQHPSLPPSTSASVVKKHPKHQYLCQPTSGYGHSPPVLPREVKPSTFLVRLVEVFVKLAVAIFTLLEKRLLLGRMGASCGRHPNCQSSQRCQASFVVYVFFIYPRGTSPLARQDCLPLEQAVFLFHDCFREASFPKFSYPYQPKQFLRRSEMDTQVLSPQDKAPNRDG